MSLINFRSQIPLYYQQFFTGQREPFILSIAKNALSIEFPSYYTVIYKPHLLIFPVQQWFRPMTLSMFNNEHT